VVVLVAAPAELLDGPCEALGDLPPVLKIDVRMMLALGLLKHPTGVSTIEGAHDRAARERALEAAAGSLRERARALAAVRAEHARLREAGQSRTVSRRRKPFTSGTGVPVGSTSSTPG
jgi:hypothetical protein